MDPNPWLYLKEHWSDVPVYIRLLGGDWGRTIWTPDGPQIYLAHTLGPIARRVTLAHEIQHLEHGLPHDLDENEQVVVADTARWLLPDVDEIGHRLVDLDVARAARELQVTRSVLLDRLDVLTHAEQGRLGVLLTKASSDSVGAFYLN